MWGKLHLKGLHYAQYRHPFEGLLSYIFCLHVCVCNAHSPEEGVRSQELELLRTVSDHSAVN